MSEFLGSLMPQVMGFVGELGYLVVAVVGVSFAFFNYSRQGTTNNVITTGSIVFNYLDQNQENDLDSNPGNCTHFPFPASILRHIFRHP